MASEHFRASPPPSPPRSAFRHSGTFHRRRTPHWAHGPDIERGPRPYIIDAEYPTPRPSSHTAHEFTLNFTEFRGVDVIAVANHESLINLLHHYTINGRGRDVWRSRHRANRSVREAAARSSRNEVGIDTDPRPGTRSRPSTRFDPGFDPNWRSDDGDSSSDDWHDNSRFPRGGGPSRGGPGGKGETFNHEVHEYMTPASGRPPGSIHVAERPVPYPVQDQRLVVYDRHQEDRDVTRSVPQPRIIADDEPRHGREEHGPRIVEPEPPSAARVDVFAPFREEIERRAAEQREGVRGERPVLRGGGRPPRRSEVPTYCFMFDKGKPILIKTERQVNLRWSNQDLISHLRSQYQALHFGWLFKPYTWILDIGMVYVLVWVFDERTRRLILANKAELVESPGKSGSLSAHDFRYLLDNPPPGKCFPRAVAGFLARARGTGERRERNPQVLLMFEFANLPRAKVLVTLALITLPLSAVAGVLYAVLQGPVADGISLASYIATAFSLFFAILGAGSLLGIDKPHIYTADDDLLEEYIVRRRRLREGLFRVPRRRFSGGGGGMGGKDAASV
ncbi:hypothetical protein QBC39DRAFT_353769 [Podospora conica]|nr:hypothetical protein QBC39DRAFT_353769 [Schizothecium conicum]